MAEFFKINIFKSSIHNLNYSLVVFMHRFTLQQAMVANISIQSLSVYIARLQGPPVSSLVDWTWVMSLFYEALSVYVPRNVRTQTD